jgi:predicted MFS family arabinose efflux permease
MLFVLGVPHVTLRKSSITLALAVGYFLVAANIAFIPPLLEFMRPDLGLAPNETTLLLGAFPLVTFLGNIVLGPYIDRFGRKPFLLAGSTGCAILFFASALATDATTVIILRGLMGITMPMIGASVFPSVVDQFPTEERMKVTAYIMAAFSLAQLATMPLGIVLGGYVSWRAAFLALAMLSVFIFVLVLVAFPKMGGSSPGAVTFATYKSNWSSFASTPWIRSSLLSYAAASIGLFVILGLYPTWLLGNLGGAGEGINRVAVLFLLGELGGLVGSLVAGRFASLLVSRQLQLVAATIGLIATTVPMMPLFGGQYAGQIGAFVAFSTGRALALTVFLAVVYQTVDESRRSTLNGTMNAVYQLAAGAGVSLGSLLYVWDSSFWSNAGVAALAFALSAGVLGMSLWRGTAWVLAESRAVQREQAVEE